MRGDGDRKADVGSDSGAVGGLLTEVESGGVPIHYEVEGEGLPVLMHTGAGGDLGMWRSAGYVTGLHGVRAILMDHRGHGGSGRPRDVEDHRIERYVADVVAVLDHAGVDRAVFLGYSDGARVGLAFAAAHPDRVAGLVALGALGEPEVSLGERADRAGRIRETGMPALIDALRVRESDLPDWFADQMLSTDPEMYALELVGWSTWSGAWPLFERIGAPTLIVVGEREEDGTGLADRHARDAAARMPSGRAVVLPKLGHVGLFVRSDLVLPHIAALLDEISATVSSR